MEKDVPETQRDEEVNVTDTAPEPTAELPLSLDDEIVEIKKLLETDPDDFQAQCRLGEVYFAKGMLDEAYTNVVESHRDRGGPPGADGGVSCDVLCQSWHDSRDAE